MSNFKITLSIILRHFKSIKNAHHINEKNSISKKFLKNYKSMNLILISIIGTKYCTEKVFFKAGYLQPSVFIIFTTKNIFYSKEQYTHINKYYSIIIK